MVDSQYIFNEANEAKTILQSLYNGKNVLEINTTDPEHVEKRIMQLMHFRQYTHMYKYFFQEWDTSLNEQTYLDTAAEAQELHTLLNHDVYKEMLIQLLFIRSQMEYKSCDDIHDSYVKKMGDMWFEAGLISGLAQNHLL